MFTRDIPQAILTDGTSAPKIDLSAPKWHDGTTGLWEREDDQISAPT
jgi:hypothetical protein